MSSHLIYGLVIWGSMLTKRKKISKIQLDCICIINKRYAVLGDHSSCTTTVLPFEDLIKQELIKLGYNISNNRLPRPIIDLYGKKRHKYPTRRKNIPDIYPHTDYQYNISFMCKSLKYYSELPGITRDINSTTVFKKALKNYLTNIKLA